MEKAASSPLFLRGNPFVESPAFRSHYHPSSPRRLPQKQGRTVVEPGKSQQLEPEPGPPSPADPPSPPDTQNSPGAAGHQGDSADSGSTSRLEESWPSTESSNPLTPEGLASRDSRAQSVGGLPAAREMVRADTGWSEGRESGPTESSIIAKYIQRFRHAQPLSREEREHGAGELGTESKEFWWLRNSPPSSSTPTEDTDRFNRGIGLFTNARGGPGNQSPLRLTRIRSLQRNASPPSLSLPSLALLKTGLSSVEEPSDVSQLEPFDPETIRLQERANHLLERSESSLSGPVPVSSDGVGSPSLSDGASVEEPSRRPIYVPPSDLAAGDGIMKQLPAVPDARYAVRAPPFSARPEEDILYQWRLQRKMEAARDSPWPLLPQRKPQSPPVRLVRQIEEADEEAQEDKPSAAGPSPERCRDRERGGEIGAVTPPHRVKSQPAVAASVVGPELLLHLRPARPWRQPAARGHRSDPQVTDGGRGQRGDRGEDPGPAGEGQGSAESRSDQSPADGGQRLEGAASAKPRGRPERSLTDCAEPARRGHGSRRGASRPGRDRASQGRGTSPSTHPQPGRPGHSAPRGGKPWGPDPRRAGPTRCGSDRDRDSSSDEFCSPPADRLRTEIRSAASAGRASALAQSNVRHVLGQVVSERIFSPPTSPRHSSSKPEEADRTTGDRQSHSFIPDTRQTPAAVTQLLEEAEESDGVEFEEDSLLQVLRQQRAWVRLQLREADMRLTALDWHER